MLSAGRTCPGLTAPLMICRRIASLFGGWKEAPLTVKRKLVTLKAIARLIATSGVPEPAAGPALAWGTKELSTKGLLKGVRLEVGSAMGASL